MARIRKTATLHVAGALASLSICLLSCASADAVATFAAASTKSLNESRPIFNDFPDSYARRFCDQAELTRNFADLTSIRACVPPAQTANLEALEQEAHGLLVVSQALTDYFTAIQQLASFGTATPAGDKDKDKSDQPASGPSATAATQSDNPSAASEKKTRAVESAKSAKFTPDEASAIGELAQLAVRAASRGYVRHHLAPDLNAADPHIQTVTAALQRVTATDYSDDLLAKERQALHERYRDAARNEPSAAVTLLLYADWSLEVHKLDDRQDASKAYSLALQTIREGHHKLASEPSRLTTKSLASELELYTSDLQSLGSKIQKAF